MFSENTQNEKFFDENGKCLSCGWMEEFPNSHIEYCGGGGCSYIRNRYTTWINEDGELEWSVKKRVVRKKPVNIETITYSFNPIEIMKKLPTDINIYINEFLYDKNGYNEGLVKHFNRQVLYDDTFIKMMNKLYFKMLHKTHEYNEMNDYEYAIRKALAGNEFYFASSMIFEDYETDDGRPIDEMFVKGDGGEFRLLIVDEDELAERYTNGDFINERGFLNEIDDEILFKYIYENLSSFNKECCLEPTQIRALQKSRNNLAYEVLKSYINMVGSEEQFYEWYVNYFTEDAYRQFYDDNDIMDEIDLSFQDIRQIDMGWKKTWIVIFN